MEAASMLAAWMTSLKMRRGGGGDGRKEKKGRGRRGSD
jgi:hypothetical protein